MVSINHLVRAIEWFQLKFTFRYETKRGSGSLIKQAKKDGVLYLQWIFLITAPARRGALALSTIYDDNKFSFLPE